MTPEEMRKEGWSRYSERCHHKIPDAVAALALVMWEATAEICTRLDALVQAKEEPDDA